MWYNIPYRKKTTNSKPTKAALKNEGCFFTAHKNKHREKQTPGKPHQAVFSVLSV